MKWYNQQVNLYNSHNETGAGRIRTLRDVLMCDALNNIGEIIQLRGLDRQAPDYDQQKRAIKTKLQCHTTGAQVWTRDGKIPEAERITHKTGLTQIDIDHVEAQGFDVEELKQFIFSFPFTCFVARSCSGDGIFAIMAVSEPDKLCDYMAHLHATLAANGIQVDSKGKNYTDLRYCTYDGNMLIKEDVEPLRIKHTAKTNPTANRLRATQPRPDYSNPSKLIQTQIQLIAQAKAGQRWETVQRVAYTLGGLQDDTLLDSICTAIDSNPAFNSTGNKYHHCARACFEAGRNKPLTKPA